MTDHEAIIEALCDVLIRLGARPEDLLWTGYAKEVVDDVRGSRAGGQHCCSGLDDRRSAVVHDALVELAPLPTGRPLPGLLISEELLRVECDLARFLRKRADRITRRLARRVDREMMGGNGC